MAITTLCRSWPWGLKYLMTPLELVPERSGKAVGCRYLYIASCACLIATSHDTVTNTFIESEFPESSSHSNGKFLGCN